MNKEQSNVSPLRISVIIPAYNAEGTISEAIESCLAQTFPPLEVIIVDDGSTDRTCGLAEEYSRRDIHLLKQANGGVSRARNAGASRANGDWFLFLDADDMLVPGALADLAKTVCSHPEAAVTYGMVIERRKPPAHPRLNGFAFAAGVPPLPAVRNFWRNAIITPGSALIRGSDFNAVGGFFPGYEPLEDRDIFIKLGLIAPFAFCDRVVLDKRWAPASHGSQHAKRIYRGQLAQRALRTWCCKRGIDTSWMPEDREILRRALDEAVWRREASILGPLREEGKRLGLLHWRSALLARLRGGSVPGWVYDGTP